MTIMVVGDLVTDVVAVPAGPVDDGTDTDATISVTGGGSAANTAAWLADIGRSVVLVAAIGEDAAGRQRVAELEAAGVTCAVARYPTTTGSIVVIATGTERTMLRDRGASACLTPENVAEALGGHPDAVHLHLSGYVLQDRRTAAAGQYALAAARRAGLTVSVDAASAAPLRQTPRFLPWVRGVDLLFANRDEATVLVGEGTPEDQAIALTRHVSAAVVKLGAEGAVWADADGTVARVPAEPVPVVDSTGAGDAFAAGVLASWLSGNPPTDVLAAGAALGAAAVRRVGARPYP